MKRTHLNLLIDALSFGAFLFLTSTGVLLRIQLPPGSGGLAGRGSGYAEGQQTVVTLWGWSRHDWGTIHYWVASSLMAILAVHLFLHWKWIVCVVRGNSTDRSGLRLGLGALGLVALVLLAVAPWMSPVAEQTRAKLLERANASSPTDSLTEQLRGSMTLSDVADLAQVPVDDLVARLDLPHDASLTERVGPLLRAHNLHLDDLRTAIRELTVPQSEAQQE